MKRVLPQGTASALWIHHAQLAAFRELFRGAADVIPGDQSYTIDTALRFIDCAADDLERAARLANDLEGLVTP